MLIEKFFSENSHNLSVGIANVNPKTKNLEENKKSIIKALDLFSEKTGKIRINISIPALFWTKPEIILI